MARIINRIRTYRLDYVHAHEGAARHTQKIWAPSQATIKRLVLPWLREAVGLDNFGVSASSLRYRYKSWELRDRAPILWEV